MYDSQTEIILSGPATKSDFPSSVVVNPITAGELSGDSQEKETMQIVNNSMYIFFIFFIFSCYKFSYNL